MRPGTAALGLPVGLSGLSFSPHSLAVTIGELLLHAADVHAAVDVEFGVPSLPQTAGDGGSNDNGSGDASALVAAWWCARRRPDLEGTTHAFFMARLGCRVATEAHCSALVGAVRRAASRSKRASLMGRCLGLLEPAVPVAGVGALLQLHAQLQAECGPLRGEAIEGCGSVLARNAATIAVRVLRPGNLSPCPALAQLQAGLLRMAGTNPSGGNGGDEALDVDDVLEQAASAWAMQRAADETALAAAFSASSATVCGTGTHSCIMLAEDFSAMLAQVRCSAQRRTHTSNRAQHPAA